MTQTDKVHAYLLTHDSATIHQITLDTGVPYSTAYAALKALDAQPTPLGDRRVGWNLPNRPHIDEAQAAHYLDALREIRSTVNRLIREIQAQTYPNHPNGFLAELDRDMHG